MEPEVVAVARRRRSRRKTMSASRLIAASYRDLGSPPEVGARFLRHLVTNPRTLSALYRMVAQRRGGGGIGSAAAAAAGGGSGSGDPDGGQQQQRGGDGQPLSASNNNSASAGAGEDVSLEIDAFQLVQSDPELGHLLLRFPSTLIPLLEDAAMEAQRMILRVVEGPNNGGTDASSSSSSCLSKKVHARLVHLPPHSTCCKPSVSSVTSSDVGKMVQICGTVVRASPVRMIECARAYRCRDKKCGYTFVTHADYSQQNNALPRPSVCPRSARGECDSTKFEMVAGQSVHTDYQELKIQESTSRLSRIGSIPRSMLVKLEHDLVNSCQPGDEVFVVGSLLAQWHPVSANLDCHVSMALRAHSVRVTNGGGGDEARGGSSASSWAGLGVDGDSREKMRREFETFWNASPQNEARPIAARNFICRAVCPKLYGMLVIKLSLLITMIGGTAEVVQGSSTSGRQDGSSEGGAMHNGENEGGGDDGGEEDCQPEQFTLNPSRSKRNLDERHGARGGSQSDAQGAGAPDGRLSGNGRGTGRAIQSRRRPHSHILLVGDPGTGKSQFLRFAAALSPRSVLTTGVGTTSAGLTCAAVKDGTSKEFTLEAGALVLADRGVCCIDEFGCIREEDRTTIHEAMEQQTISVAKAGIVCKLNTRATVVAVMNPRGSLYATEDSVSKNTNIGSPLLSRFDLIFIMLDSSNLDRDDKIASFLLNQSMKGSGFSSSIHSNSDADESHWSMDKLRAYIATVKDKFQPSVSPEAALLLQRHYSRCRNLQQHSSIQITVRFLESLIRLSQAHARLMYRGTVTLQDAVAVVLIMESSAATSGGMRGDLIDQDGYMYRPPMESDFPADDAADYEFLRDQHAILKRYDMLGYMPPEQREVFERDGRPRDPPGAPHIDTESRRSAHASPYTHGQDDNELSWNQVAHPTDESQLPNPKTPSWSSPPLTNARANESGRTDCWGRMHSTPHMTSTQFTQSINANQFCGHSEVKSNSMQPDDRYPGELDADEAVVANLERIASQQVRNSEDDSRGKRRRKRNREAD